MRLFGLCRLFPAIATLTVACLVGSPALMARAPQDSPVTPAPAEPTIQPASGEGQLAIKQFKFSNQLICTLFAAEPDVANIVSFNRDYTGRLFVCETFRQQNNSGVEDNRSHGHWMDEELQARTVQDRINYVLKHVPNAAELYTVNDDRIRLVIDANEDGVADESTVFAKGFNRLEMGTGADVLSFRDQIYYTCIPDLFKLYDSDGDGISDRRESLHTGYGVRFAFRGHDLHGLIVGPDGRLYFSVGDRGYNLSPDVVDPTSGAVFRCELDGSNLEVFSTGLRNPQNLAFDDLGNLFTGDNNSDSGDKARWVYLVRGGDSGWRMYYQYLPDRGPFNREKIWHPFHQDSPAYIVPPVGNISDGPSGLDYYPGTGFGDEYQGRFFLCDFRGSSVNSGIRSFRNQQVGAFWKLVDAEQPIWGILPTDLQFASDGKLYVSDWVNGWVGENKGRIYSFTHKEFGQSEIVKEVASLLKSGLARQSNEKLGQLLGHRDRRVRQEAQFELVNRSEFDLLKEIARTGSDRLSRIHAVWGLAQLVRKQPLTASKDNGSKFTAERLAELIERLCADSDLEIRAQAAHLVAEIEADMQPAMIVLLEDDSSRVRYFAGMALSKMGDERCLPAVSKMLVENEAADPIVRHGGIMAIHGVLLRTVIAGNPVALGPFGELARHDSPAVRLAFAVAIRKLLALPRAQRNEMVTDEVKLMLARLLRDADGIVCLEAARAVYDLPVNDLIGRLAIVRTTDDSGAPRIGKPHLQDALISRVIQANYRVADQASAERLAEVAVGKMSLQSRLQALAALENWITPSNNDPLLHDWRPVDTSRRKISDAQAAVVQHYKRLVIEDEAIGLATLNAVGKLKIPGLEHELSTLLLTQDQPAGMRVVALRNLFQLEPERFSEIIKTLQSAYEQNPNQFSPELAAEMARLTSDINEPFSLSILKHLVEAQYVSTAIKQQAIAATSKLQSEPAKEWLKSLFQQVAEKTLPAQLRLDVVLALQNHSDQELKRAADDYLVELASNKDLSTRFADTLVGGNFDSGKLVFETKSEVSCIRCHRVVNAEIAVGPNLADVGSKRSRQQLLESIIEPNREISEGFGQVKVQTIDGLMFTGLLKEDTSTQMTLLDAEGKQIRISRDDIEAVQPGMSSMPLDLVKHLSLTELRDLIEFLAQQTNGEPNRGIEHSQK